MVSRRGWGVTELNSAGWWQHRALHTEVQSPSGAAQGFPCPCSGLVPMTPGHRSSTRGRGGLGMSLLRAGALGEGSLL